MARVLKMFRGVAIGRAVATTDMAAGQAETEMHPRRSAFQALLTARRAGSHVLNSRHVWTGHESPPGRRATGSSRVFMIVILGSMRSNGWLGWTNDERE